LWGVLSLVLCLALVSSAVAPALAEDAEGGCDDCLSYTIMRPDRETLERWIEAYNNAPRAYIEMEGFQVPSPRGSLSLLDHLEYTPAERDQGTCGNCWAWAGTGVMEVALHVQEGIKDRLSVQYINSCEGTVIGKTCCTGGSLFELADFYDATDMAIPWSNTNANWQDGDASCDTACGLISTTPNYPITYIQETTISTQTVDQATAIANIKNVLDQNKAVWFGFILPNNTAWDGFGAFWASESESDVYAMDQFCGVPYDDSPGEGGGHAVLCVGYNDDDPGNSYWVMLNSWGTTTGRLNGLFRIDMDMNYQCMNGLYNSFYWQTLDVTFDIAGQPDITVSPASFDETLPANTTAYYTMTIGNAGSANLTYNITDRETTGGLSVAGGESLSLIEPASMMLEVPLESSPVEPENSGEARAGWQNIMTDGFEGAFPGVWDLWVAPGATDAYWGKDNYRAHSDSYSVFCAKSGSAGVNPPADYPNDMRAWMIYGPFSLADASDAELNFYYWLQSEENYDYFNWLASTNGTNFYGWRTSGNSSGWASESFDLTDVYTLGNLCGQSQVWIAFIFTSDETGTDKGAFIDDVVLRKYVAGALPHIDSLSPNEGPVDARVVISGSDFGSTQGASTVTFDGVNADVSTWSDTEIVAWVPEGASSDVVVHTSQGDSNAVPFTVTDSPVDYWAVIVGVADYPGTENDLSFPDEDAWDVHDALLANPNWEEGHITMLLDNSATKANIHNAITQMGSNGDGNDLFFFHYSGHGGNYADQPPLDETDGLDEYLAQYDFATDPIWDDEFAEWLAALPSRKVAVSLDACYSGGQVKASGEGVVRCVAAEGLPAKGDGLAKDIDDITGGVALAACAEDEVGYEVLTLQNGLFTYYLVEGLGGPADSNADDQISMEEAFNYLDPLVSGYSVPEPQNPQMYDGYPDELVILLSELNNPPNIPSDPSPANNATGVSIDSDLSWTGGDPDLGDTITYDVYFDTVGATTLVSDDQSATTYDPGTLSHNTTYYWKIVAADNHTASTTGPVWDFTTATEDCPWLDETPKSGLVESGDSHNITVSINTTGLGSNYTAEIVIASNDPDEDPTVVPVTLHVSAASPGEPDITVSPASFNKTLAPNTTRDYTLTISNDGDAELTYNITNREAMGGGSGLAPIGTPPPPPSAPGNPDADNVRPVEEPDIRPGAQEEHAPHQIFEEGDTLEELRDKIGQNGYNFTVDHNWVYDMSPEEKEDFFGRHDSGLLEGADTSEDIGPLARHLGTRQLPSQFDWRNYNGHSYIGAIRNQGTCGSCYAFGACAAAEGTYNLAMGLYDGDCSDFSESFIMWCLGNLTAYNSHFYGCDGADYTYSELTALTVEGISSEADFPYQTSDGCGDHWDDPRITFGSWYRIPCGDIDAIKTAIMTYGPVDAAVYVTAAFQAYSGDIYEDTNTDCYEDPCYNTPTNHCVALVGWDDNGDPDTNGYWILRNSWGAYDWGESGYMRIKYRSARVACEACYLVYSGGEDCPWLNVSPTCGSVAPGSSHNITVSINTTGLGSNYTAEIVIASNDPDEDPKVVPVNLQVVQEPTLELIEGVNIITYTGATTSLPEALTNIAELVDIIWARGIWTGGEWHRFFFYHGFPVGELEELEDGRAYIIVVSEHCIWELPQ